MRISKQLLRRFRWCCGFVANLWDRIRDRRLVVNSYYWKSSGVDRIRLIRKACRSISDKV
ncbi:MAG: hypothetical protein BECKG1743D_GA0114223_101832 [Candidatus Kentron sp. G]|nr:MAG: hypothetical protein BECKG1743F_GA0114225_101633 [Candidatus Kentron sp. G]VFM97689.1 MAG: hypothetical protein BECKG1743E_GA0114224_101462 [Candidatus Kentron sp. G]VFN00313.1 MAG: hypothetical protein BECKG1743D_GA0114223_101832 [Candidatus Kentron sp. G]